MTPEEDLVKRMSSEEASNDAGSVEAAAGEDQVQTGSPESDSTVPDKDRLAEWLKAQLQLPDYVSADDWTPEHTSEFSCFCSDPNRKHWFLWMETSDKPTGRDVKVALGQEENSISHTRLAFADQLSADGVAQLLRPAAGPEESGATFVFIVKKGVTVALSRPLEEQLLCLSLQGPLLQQIATIVRGVCVPLLRENCLWPESLKKGILRRLSSFAGQLNEASSSTNSCNTLVLPSEDLSDIAQSLTDRDMIQRLEGLVLSWTRQVKEILSAQEDVAAAARLADDNLRFLQVLRAPCQALSEADLEQIPDIIAELLMAVRVVATHSEYYTTPARIGGLLRNISCEVIRRGQASIDVDAMWAGDVSSPMESLQQAIHCGLVLNKLFKQLSTLIEAEGKAPCPWDFADRAAFAEVGSKYLFDSN
ncbi:hypothetical protein Emed_005767 [Eimeria media]